MSEDERKKKERKRHIKMKQGLILMIQYKQTAGKKQVPPFQSLSFVSLVLSSYNNLSA